MTSQITDTFLRGGEAYFLLGMDSHLPDPTAFGMTPAMLHTACYRGFYCTYEVDDRLLLQELTLREADGDYRPINGVLPAVDEGNFRATYKELNLPIPYSGVVRLGKDPIGDLYVHMGYPKASAFEVVIELALSEGTVTGIRDRSGEAAVRRGEFKRSIEANPGEGVPDSFSLDLDIW